MQIVLRLLRVRADPATVSRSISGVNPLPRLDHSFGALLPAQVKTRTHPGHFGRTDFSICFQARLYRRIGPTTPIKLVTISCRPESSNLDPPLASETQRSCRFSAACLRSQIILIIFAAPPFQPGRFNLNSGARGRATGIQSRLINFPLAVGRPAFARPEHTSDLPSDLSRDAARRHWLPGVWDWISTKNRGARARGSKGMRQAADCGDGNPIFLQICYVAAIQPFPALSLRFNHAPSAVLRFPHGHVSAFLLLIMRDPCTLHPPRYSYALDLSSTLDEGVGVALKTCLRRRDCSFDRVLDRDRDEFSRAICVCRLCGSRRGDACLDGVSLREFFLGKLYRFAVGRQVL